MQQARAPQDGKGGEEPISANFRTGREFWSLFTCPVPLFKTATRNCFRIARNRAVFETAESAYPREPLLKKLDLSGS
jgi:hypothetical protein